MLNFTTFSHESFGNVRTIMLYDEPWFVATDVCECLGIGNYRQALTYLDYDEKDVLITETFDRNQVETIIINESGLYTLIFRSRKLKNKVFKRWITHGVLPSIRNTEQRKAALNQALQGAQTYYYYEGTKVI